MNKKVISVHINDFLGLKTPLTEKQFIQLPWVKLFRPLHGNSFSLPWGLPEVRPKVCWYVSGGRDFRPLVFWSDVYREQRLAHLALPRPEMFVYTCLSPDGGGLHGLKVGDVLFQDGRTFITLLSIQPLRIDRKRVGVVNNPKYVQMVDDPLRAHDYDAALMQVEVRSLTMGACERFPLLYLAMENLNAFDVLMSKGYFSVESLVATREGLGMGGCRKSIIRHLYTENRIQDTSFNPQYVVTWSDSTDELFRKSARPYYPELCRVAPYIPESLGGFPHHLYRLYENQEDCR